MSVHALSERVEELEQQLAAAEAGANKSFVEKLELADLLVAKDEALQDALHFLTQIDPVCWPSRQEARKIITTIRNALASPAAEPQRSNTVEAVQEALQKAWDDYCADAHEFPDCFEIIRGRRLGMMADFSAGNFARMVAAELNSAAQPAPVAQSEQPSLDLVAHLRRQIEFSERTFGPGTRTMGVLDHIRKELKEIESDPADLSEWVDVVILALDGAWRAGHTAEQIASAIVAKQTKNEGRQWPDWRTADPNKAIEHDRSGETAIQSCHGCKYSGCDPDGPYCAHPKSMEHSCFGLSLDAAVREHCTKDRLNWESVAQSQEGEQHGA